MYFKIFNKFVIIKKKRGIILKIKCLPVGELQANCYLLILGKKALLIDPGAEKEKIEKELNNLELVEVLVTHNHFDHTGALSYFLEKYKLNCNEKSNEFLYETIKTPGHSKDSVTFYFPNKKVMFTGDFLFQGTIGRMDLPGGDIKEMQKSLQLISSYNDEIKIYPGHGPSTTLGEEKKRTSYYL